MNKRKVLLLIQSGYSARNFILSGFLNDKDLEFTFWSDQDYIQEYDIKNKLIKLPEYDYHWKVNFIVKIKNRAELFFNVKKTNNKNYLSYLIGIHKSNSLRGQFKKVLSNTIARFYANEKGICQGDPSALILITEDHIDGSGFDCTLSNFTPAGTGLATYDGVCTIDGIAMNGLLTFDLGNYADHYEVSLPGSSDWLALYPCSPAKK